MLLNVGDNLRDFDERFRFPDAAKATGADLDAAIRKRKAEVDATREEWGRKWVICRTRRTGSGRRRWDGARPISTGWSPPSMKRSRPREGHRLGCPGILPPAFLDRSLAIRGRAHRGRPTA